MKIYLACTVRGDRGGVAAGRAMCERLHALGHEVLTTHLLADGVDEAEAALPEADVFRRDLGWLEGCDVLVAEASGSSYGVGFEVGYVLSRADPPARKPSSCTTRPAGTPSRGSSPATATRIARLSPTRRSRS